MDIKNFGIGLTLLGVGAFILPHFGLQFKLINIFGGAQWIVAIIAILVGIVLTILGVAVNQTNQPKRTEHQQHENPRQIRNE